MIKKLQYFVEAASLFGRGEFKRTISFKSDDEIKKLADSFNVMAKALMEKMRLERKYLSQIIEAQENERRRISRELHDEIGQALYAIKFNLEMVDKDLPHTTSVIRGRLGRPNLCRVRPSPPCASYPWTSGPPCWMIWV